MNIARYSNDWRVDEIAHATSQIKEDFYAQ